MKIERRIVTALTNLGRSFVLLLALVFTFTVLPACHSSNESEKTEFVTTPADKKLLEEGKASLREAKTIQTELMDKYQLFIASEPKIVGKQVIHTFDFATNYDFSHLTKEKRNHIRSQLERYVSLVTRVLELDEKLDVTEGLHDEVLTAKESAEAFQRAIDQFEKVHGINYSSNSKQTTPTHFIDI